MPKLKNLTAGEIDAIAGKADDMLFEINAAADMVRKGAVDAIPEPIQRASTLVALSRAASDLAGAILTRKLMSQDRDDLQKSLEAQLAAAEK